MEDLALTEYSRLVEGKRCQSCGKRLPVPAVVQAEPHPNGWRVKGLAGRQSLWVHCHVCNYDSSLWKLDVPGSTDETHNEIALNGRTGRGPLQVNEEFVEHMQAVKRQLGIKPRRAGDPLLNKQDPKTIIKTNRGFGDLDIPRFDDEGELIWDEDEKMVHDKANLFSMNPNNCLFKWPHKDRRTVRREWIRWRLAKLSKFVDPEFVCDPSRSPRLPAKEKDVLDIFGWQMFKELRRRNLWASPPAGVLGE